MESVSGRELPWSESPNPDHRLMPTPDVSCCTWEGPVLWKTEEPNEAVSEVGFDKRTQL